MQRSNSTLAVQCPKFVSRLQNKHIKKFKEIKENVHVGMGTIKVDMQQL